ncbi:MAG: LysR family transcriptional regulator [Lautropia sp.]
MKEARGNPTARLEGVLLRLRLQHLRMLVALSESSSIQEASRRMHLTQSAASKLLGDLERAFDTRIFDRGRLGLRATPAGQALSRRAARLLRDVEAAREEQLLFRHGAATLLRVGGLPLALATLMPEVLARCRDEWPELVLQLREATARPLLRDVHAGVVDCALGRIVLEEPIESAATDLWLDEMVREELVPVARSNHPLAGRRRVSPKDLGQFEWVTPAVGSTAHTIFLSALQRASVVPPRPAVECDASYGTILAYVRRFGFVGLLPRTIALREAAVGPLTILKTPLRMELPPIAFICRRERIDSPEIARIHGIARAAAGLDPRGGSAAAAVRGLAVRRGLPVQDFAV